MVFKETGKKTARPNQQNFGLSESAFERLLQALRNGDEELIVHIYEYHMALCTAYLIKEYDVKRNTAYDLFMDTLMDMREKMLSGKIKYGNLQFLFTRMAHNNLVDQYKKQKKLRKCIQHFLNTEDHETTSDQFLNMLYDSIASLDKGDESLIKDIYLMEKKPQDLAVEYKISYANLRKRKERALKKLKALFFSRFNQ